MKKKERKFIQEYVVEWKDLTGDMTLVKWKIKTVGGKSHAL